MVVLQKMAPTIELTLYVMINFQDGEHLISARNNMHKDWATGLTSMVRIVAVLL